ncbi:MAG: 23S rRNA (adenine(2503)-C(2))-methyltransferase RlmN [Candidatus Falkowbacteria bacterium]
MNLAKLSEVLAKEPTYRYKQVLKAIFQDLISDWPEATTLPKSLRERLATDCPLTITATASKGKAVRKALIELTDGAKIETVLMGHGDERNTVCVSSQVGCPLGCLFCATGKLGFTRNLVAEEIVEQVIYFARELKKEQKTISNIVFMGMGEPFLNYDEVLKAIRWLHDPERFNMGARRFSISTAGLPEGIKRLAKEGLEINLALSLHAPTNDLRQQIMPIAKQYSLKQIFTAIDYYVEKTNRRVMYEYVMINNLNDKPEHARHLAKLLSGRLGFVNLIAYNQTGMFSASPSERIKTFIKILEAEKISVVERQRFGQGIDAACGQLAAKKRTLKK